jgi:hypothetical protein
MLRRVPPPRQAGHAARLGCQLMTLEMFDAVWLPGSVPSEPGSTGGHGPTSDAEGFWTQLNAGGFDVSRVTTPWRMALRQTRSCCGPAPQSPRFLPR